MAKQWTADEVLEVSGEFQRACVLMAAADLDVFGALMAEAKTAERLAADLQADTRAMRVLLDALAAMELLTKDGEAYRPAPGAVEALTEAAPHSAAAMVRHRANCLRGWAQLAGVVRSGIPAERPPSVRGAAADLASFIEAMNVVSRQAAPGLVAAIGPPQFTHLLDVGGGPGTWTIAFLQAAPGATATLYDRPDVIPIARKHVEAAGLVERVTLAAGNFYEDESLPPGADLAWVSAITHQNSRRQNRELFAKVHAALAPGGRVLVRDVVMDESRTAPLAGAMFAVNMLVNTPAGGTYTFAELSEDLLAAGFADPVLLRRDEGMNSVLQATRP